jgi:hypothetical protein
MMRLQRTTKHRTRKVGDEEIIYPALLTLRFDGFDSSADRARTAPPNQLRLILAG